MLIKYITNYFRFSCNMAAKFSEKIDLFFNFVYPINFMLAMDAQRVPEHKNITFLAPLLTCQRSLYDGVGFGVCRGTGVFF